MTTNTHWRKSEQYLIPSSLTQKADAYDIYPAMHLPENQLFVGFESLAKRVASRRILIIDGFIGVFFEDFRLNIDLELRKQGIIAEWFDVNNLYKETLEIEALIAPFLGGDDPIFGKRTTLSLLDFFDTEKLEDVKPISGEHLKIVYGCGASILGWLGTLVYLDVPKNEIQFRSRAGSIANLGAAEASNPKSMYKRFYFVDWVVLNNHKQELLPQIDIFVDTQRPEEPVWVDGNVFRDSIKTMAENVFRVRPWFEPGAWGGTWIKEHIAGLNKNVPNYAWSFELIVPENGLLLESSGKLLEFSFDCLMFLEGKSVLGDCYERYGYEFPIRFDFLDTFDGGNLSIQCHPRLEYMKEHFGENFTQEETYYILDTKDNANVYLGFQDDIDSEIFRSALEKSFSDSEPVEIEKFVQKHKASKHDLFLIPPGTIHGSGTNNLVLEISSTPYIFTFKMYDWLRLDLDGKPRTININRGMDNLYFDRKGDYVTQNLISKPVKIDEGNHWVLYHLPTHQSHLYDVHRYHFTGEIEIETLNKCHVLSLVEGSSLELKTKNGISQRFAYAETFVIPANAISYRITNYSNSEAILVKAFVK
ncbi:MAG: class I mannose-6-phosphate isomerase [Bacteroidales bacterium]